MTRVFISLGSNVEAERNLREAIARLRKRFRVLAISSIYGTKAVGKAGQPDFLNAAALIATEQAPESLKQALLRIEAEMGRVRTEDKFAPRAIDLDIALFGKRVLELGGRHIPDPDLLHYPHLAWPLAEIAPDYIHPETKKPLAEIAKDIPGKGIQIIEQWKVNEMSDRTDCIGDIECAVRAILATVGEDINREGLLDTPARVARMYEEIAGGYKIDPAVMVNDAIFSVSYDEMVMVKDIDYYSMCEHHMLPFFGKAHVGYIPNGKVIGLSKIPRVVDMFARRFQLQERMTQQIAEFLQDTINPVGVGVVVEGVHLCAGMRGIKKPNTRMVTSAMLGSFKTNEKTRNEFLAHLRKDVSF